MSRGRKFAEATAMRERGYAGGTFWKPTEFFPESYSLKKKGRNIYIQNVIHLFFFFFENFNRSINSLAVQPCLHESWGLNELPALEKALGQKGVLPILDVGCWRGEGAGRSNLSTHCTVCHRSQMRAKKMWQEQQKPFLCLLILIRYDNFKIIALIMYTRALLIQNAKRSHDLWLILY